MPCLPLVCRALFFISFRHYASFQTSPVWLPTKPLLALNWAQFDRQVRHGLGGGWFLWLPDKRKMPYRWTSTRHFFVVDRGIEPLCQDWESCILTIRWIDHGYILEQLFPSKPLAEGGGFEPPVREPVRQFSKLLVSATHPSFLGFVSELTKHCSQMRCKGTWFLFNRQTFSEYFLPFSG